VKVAVTGGAGFIGSNLTASLLEAGHQVSIFDNLETGNLENIENLDVEFVKGDLRNQSEVQDFFANRNLEYCIHLGAMGSVPRSIENPRTSFEANVLGTFNLLESARIARVPIIYSSSSSVYGSNLKLPKEELDWQSPISPYGSFKSSSESMLMAYGKSYDLKINIFRLFNVYGPRQNPHGAYSAVIPRWIISAFRNEPITIFGDGNQKRDFTFVEDVNKIILLTMNKLESEMLPINLAFGNPVTLNEMVSIFKEFFPRLEVTYSDVRKGDIRDSESDPKKLMSYIGDFAPTSLREGLHFTFNWYKKRFGF
jgi:UDP-glucose 4-epimerase